MNKNNGLALYSEASIDALELTDADLTQIQGAGCNAYNTWQFHHHGQGGQQFQGDGDNQRFRQSHYGRSFHDDDDNRRFQGDGDDRRFRHNCNHWGFQGDRTHRNHC